MVAVFPHRPQRHFVGKGLGGGEPRNRREVLDRGQAQRRHDSQVEPAQVELVPLERELRRGRVGVMIVVQLFAADEDSPRRHVGADVFGGRVAVAEPVADAVDHARRPERDPGDLREENKSARDVTEQNQIRQRHQGQA